METNPVPRNRGTNGLREWLRDWGNALSVLVCIVAVAYIVYVAFLVHDSRLQINLRKTFWFMNACAALLAWRASRPPSTDARTRRALSLLGAAFGSVLVGNVLSWYLGAVLRDNPLVAWTNGFFFLFYFFGLAGFLAFPLARRTRHEFWKFLLDASTVIVGGGIAIWYTVVQPTRALALGDFVGSAIALAYPVLALLLLLGVVTVLLREPGEMKRREASRLLMFGMILYLLSDLANDVTILRTGFFGISWTDLTYMVAYCIVVAGLARYHWRPPIVPPEDQGRPQVQPFTLLPYLAVALGYGMLLVIAAQEWPKPLSVLAIGALAITALVIVRQIAAVRQNVLLLAEQSARANEARFRALVQHSSDVIFIVGADSVVSYVSPTVTQIFGYAPAEIEGRKLQELVHGEDASHVFDFFRAVAPAGAVTAPAEWRIMHRDESWRHVEAIGTNLLAEPTVQGIVINTRDITERKALQAELTHQAFHDQLTGLANRALFLDRVSHALTLARRHQRTIAVIFVDLDNFKTVNDSLGHAAGDRLLVGAAQRLLTAVRGSDTVSRLGGDEFAVLIEDTFDNDAATGVVERIIESLRHPFSLDGKEVYVSASIGIATARDEDTGSDLLRNADMAMYMAKSRGKARYEKFEPRMHAEAVERLELEADLRRAIEREEFTLLYQPIVQLTTGDITGVEALVRWLHPTRGLLTPMQFIPLAEETGLIVPLGKWVVKHACIQAQRWQEARLSAVPLTLTINVSGHQLKGERVVDDVREALRESGLDPRQLVLEITESVLMHQSETMLERLRALKELGIRLAIDDFGTGYSSLGYLQRFPIDILKIDKTFVDDVGRGGNEPALARAVIALGDTLRLQTIAEGIEQKHQLNGLQELGCEMGQGFYFAKPITAAAIEAMFGGTVVVPTPPYSKLVEREREPAQ